MRDLDITAFIAFQIVIDGLNYKTYVVKSFEWKSGKLEAI